MANFKELIDKLKYLLSKYRYESVKDMIAQYPKVPNNAEIYAIYGVALIKLNDKRGLEYLKLALKLNRFVSFKFTVAIYLFHHHLYDLALPILIDLVDLGYDKPFVYYYLARSYMKVGEYAKAYHYFEIAHKLISNEEIKESIKNKEKLIDEYYQEGKFIRISGESYQKLGKKIVPGLIVYLKKDAPYKNTVPYLVVATQDNEVYGASLTVLNLNIYDITPEANSGGLNSSVTGNMVKFNVWEIEDIISQVDSNNLYYAIYNLLLYYARIPKEKLGMEQQFLAQKMRDKLQIGDVFTILNLKNGHIEYYYLNDKKEDSYVAYRLEVNDGIFKNTGEITEIPRSKIVLEVIPLKRRIKKEILIKQRTK